MSAYGDAARAVLPMLDIDSLREAEQTEVHAVADVLLSYTLAVAHLMTAMGYRSRGDEAGARREDEVVDRIHNEFLPEWAKWRKVRVA